MINAKLGEQSVNTFEVIVILLFGSRVIVVKFVDFWNAKSFISFTDLGIVKLIRLSHP